MNMLHHLIELMGVFERDNYREACQHLWGVKKRVAAIVQWRVPMLYIHILG